jgi:preprotein translocase subunit YajC
MNTQLSTANSQLPNILVVVALLAIFYLLIIRPQQKRAAQQRDLVARLQPGARIVTIGGIHGTVVEVGDVVRVRTVDGSEFELSKQAVAQIRPAEDPDSEEGDEDETVADEGTLEADGSGTDVAGPLGVGSDDEPSE